jgi:PAS domain S-box-containing protein
LLRAFLEHTSSFLAIVTPEGRILATGRLSSAFGSVIGRSVMEFTAPDQRAIVLEAFRRVRETKQIVNYETVAFGENGEPDHTYLVRAAPLLEAGEVTAIVLAPTDITERVRLAQSLMKSEEQLRMAVAATHMALWSWDVARDKVSWDARLLELFGATSEPADYETYLELVHPEDRAAVKSAVETAFATGVFPTFEHRVAPRADGIERWVLSTGSVLRDANGQTIMVTGGALDITQQKRADAQLERAQRVEALGQLTAGLAHNFNNLLAAVVPNLELALQGASSEQRSALDAAMVASLQARDLIKRLMSITGRRTPGASHSSNPREVLERAITISRATFPREIELETSFAPGVPDAAIDAADLEQVVLNLLVNARDALEAVTSRRRRVQVLLDIVQEGAVGTPVRVRVRDNGPGMTAALRARIFEPFFTTKPAQRGSGLGLADALVRVRAAGGALECHSVEGEGATFELLLPAAASRARSVPPPAPAARAPRGQTLLVVDDEAAVRNVITRMLTQYGYRVLVAENASEARSVLAAHAAEVQLVLLDQSMPHESGPEALPSLQRLSRAPIVLFTGGATELPPGAAALLEKPASAADLLRTISALLPE